jgi:hypothetical protein
VGDFLRNFAGRMRRVGAWLAPRCFVLVIFGDGSYLVARYSRLEPAHEEIAVGGDAGRCELTADLGGLRIYRYVRATAPPIAIARMGSGMVQ